jgi:predicted transcriptional regulator
MPTKKPRVYLTLSPELLELVDQIAAAEGKTRQWVIRAGIRELAKKKGHVK